jgi:hypothetical protein
MMSGNHGIVGVADHGGWAILVTATADGTLLDRRRVELVDEDLPKLPHHHDAQGLAIEAGVALVERVRTSADRHAKLALEAVASAVPGIRGIAIREYQQLPPTIAERIQNYRARNVADWVMYRKAIADAAAERGWVVHLYDARKVLQVDGLEARLMRLRRTVGPPWDKDHRVAMAAAIASAMAP